MIFLAMTLKAQAMKVKINKGCIKLESFCSSKAITNKMKRQPTEWEKIFASHLSDKGLISKIRKELIQLNSKITIQWKKWTEDLTFFSQEGIQMANRYMKKCLASLIIREMQIKTTMGYNLTLVRRATVKKTKDNMCW